METQLGYINIADAVDEDLTGPHNVSPFGNVLAVSREQLDAAVFTIGHVNCPLAVNGDAMRHMELAGPPSWLPPGRKKLPVRGKLVDSRVSIAIGDVDIPIRGERQVSRIVKRRAGSNDGAEVHAGGPSVRMLAPRSKSHQQLAVRRELADGVVEIIGAIDSVVWTNENAVRPGELA